MAVAVLLASCSPNAALTSPSPSNSHAADYRVRLDLLFGENLLLVAKVAEAAENHSDAYAAYAALMASNAGELAGAIGEALGNTAASQFATLWNTTDAGFVDYTIGVVTHDAAKSSAATASLEATGPQLGELFSGILADAPGSLAGQFQALASTVKQFVDSGFAQSYGSMYSAISAALTGAAGLGDSLVMPIAAQFPDKFPGDVSSKAVERRATANVLLMGNSYLETMLTDAVIAGRGSEVAQAARAINSNVAAIAALEQGAAATAIAQAWQQREAALQNYALTSSAPAKATLTGDFVQRLSTATGLSTEVVAAQVDATLRVVDDQRSKSFAALPADDQAAASAMVPIADAISAAG